MMDEVSRHEVIADHFKEEIVRLKDKHQLELVKARHEQEGVLAERDGKETQISELRLKLLKRQEEL